MIGKNAPGLKGFPTPNTATGIAGYLLFLFDDKEWAQYLLGAAKVLGEVYNWYEAGDMSPEEAAEAFRVVVQDAPYNLRTCPNPAGGRIFRVNSLGKVQELSDAGEWTDPTGDATIPPVPEREGGTPDDQICLAAKNATNVLQLLYENLTDSFNEHLDEAEAATALTLTIIGLIGAEFAPITFALVTFFSVVFSVLYGVLEFVGADLWDETFTKALACILKDCASNDGGVVTFDWDCFQNALAAQTSVFDLTFEQLRLFGQIEYLLLVTGGVDALNAAGATTAITDDDCSFCEAEWCYEWTDATLSDDWVFDFSSFNGNWFVDLHVDFPATIRITEATMCVRVDTVASGQEAQWWSVNYSGEFNGLPLSAGSDNEIELGGVPRDLPGLAISCAPGAGITTGSITVYYVRLRGEGDNPFGDDNCTM